MSGWKKLAAAGAGDAEILNVEDVFSTYVYAGDSQAQNINNGIALADSPSGDLGSSTLFENYNESLNKSSDLTGNSDGKTFTFSFWIYPVPTNNNTMYIYHTSGSWKNTITWSLNGTIFVSFFNNESSGGTVFEIQNPDLICPPNTWSHVIFSADMTDTSKRHLYINDSEATPSWTYSNQTIDWTRSDHAVGDDLTASTGNFNGYMAHFFFDKTYRDLSVTSTRRTFIDSARGSTSASTLAALSPILYLPMISGYSVGQNAGTGGNFTGTNSPTIVTNNGTQSVAGVGQGGLVWIKSRNTSTFPGLFDTERGVLERLRTDSTAVPDSLTRSLTAFNSNGFNLGNNGTVNQTGRDYVSWTFRKAPKFFDIVTYTGDGANSRAISHNLGSDVGTVIIKRTDSASTWAVWHRGLTQSGGTGGGAYNISLDSTAGEYSTSYINSTTSSDFTVGGGVGFFNNSGATFVAYLFAHNNGDGNFGPTGDQDIIKCGVVNTTSGVDAEIDLGFEPQWVLTKSTASDSWELSDIMRGIPTSGATTTTTPNNANAEFSSSNRKDILPNGFRMKGAAVATGSYIYIAIRRGPMAIPESSTDVFALDTFGGTLPNPPEFVSDFPVDLAMYKRTNGSENWNLHSRLIQGKRLRTNRSDAESAEAGAQFDYMNGYYDGTSVLSQYQGWMWKRAPNYFDVVTYTGNGTAGRTVSHNLGIAPEMMWVKRRDGGTNSWLVYNKDVGNTACLILNGTNASITGTIYWNDTTPTDSVFSLGTSTSANGSGNTYIAYLFASLDGVSKVGSFSGDNTSNRTIDCGFSNGAKLVIIKCTNQGGTQWFLWDTQRGISTGNDPYLLLNSDLYQITSLDLIEPNSAGFAVNYNATEDFNQSGNDYIFYAVATP